MSEALDIEPEEKRPKRYSVRDLKAFQITLPLYRQARQELGEEHSATQALRRVLEHLSCGCHRFEYKEKAEAYRIARDQASLAVCELAINETKAAEQLLQALEQDLMAALAGLLRRLDKTKRW